MPEGKWSQGSRIPEARSGIVHVPANGHSDNQRLTERSSSYVNASPLNRRFDPSELGNHPSRRLSLRGRALTPANNNLNFIVWRLRTGRRSLPVRRSWLRRARLLLNQVAWLAPAERHEIICVWSQPDCHLIDSPALRRWLLGAKDRAAFAPPLEGLRPARQFMRAAFWPNGQPKRRRLTAPAANDAVWATA